MAITEALTEREHQNSEAISHGVLDYSRYENR